MPKIAYIKKRFNKSSVAIISKANEIITEYAADGLGLTLRQLYYQFVARDLIANKQSEYKRLGAVISDARLAGLIDWYAIEDRTRNLKGMYHNTDPGDAVSDALRQFQLDHWNDQEYRVEVWIEKEALVGVIASICNKLDVPFFACKGYVSQSEMWSAAQRLIRYRDTHGQTPVIIHLGDHDPSGIDMTRDILDRQELFEGSNQIVRIALNMDQVRKHKPPPNPAKMTDTRCEGYVKKFGRSSWELDALEPRMLRSLIEKTVKKYRDEKTYKKTLKQEAEHRKVLERVVDKWETL
jgi:hypothetical protein